MLDLTVHTSNGDLFHCTSLQTGDIIIFTPLAEILHILPAEYYGILVEKRDKLSSYQPDKSEMIYS